MSIITITIFTIIVVKWFLIFFEPLKFRFKLWFLSRKYFSYCFHDVLFFFINLGVWTVVKKILNFMSNLKEIGVMAVSYKLIDLRWYQLVRVIYLTDSSVIPLLFFRLSFISSEKSHFEIECIPLSPIKLSSTLSLYLRN